MQLVNRISQYYTPAPEPPPKELLDRARAWDVDGFQELWDWCNLNDPGWLDAVFTLLSDIAVVGCRFAGIELQLNYPDWIESIAKQYVPVGTPTAAQAAQIEAFLSQQFGFEIPVLADDWNQISTKLARCGRLILPERVYLSEPSHYTVILRYGGKQWAHVPARFKRFLEKIYVGFTFDVITPFWISDEQCDLLLNHILPDQIGQPIQYLVP